MNRRAAKATKGGWSPVYRITPQTASDLMRLESIRTELDHIRLPPPVETELRRRAQVRSTHFSTQIEGNRLSLDQSEQAIRDQQAVFPGRERDVSEVRNYWNARLRVEEWAEKGRPLSEELIRRFHALVENGPLSRPSPYRTGQNAIRDAGSGVLVYLPPEAKDVPELMSDLVRWIESALDSYIPTPIVAALAHYQLVTIHPFYDGNGRTARLLATFILHRSRYGLDGFLSVEEVYAQDLTGYYAALTVHPHHNYYFGRVEADLSGWVEYSTTTLSQAFLAVAVEARHLMQTGIKTEPTFFQHLDRRARLVQGLFAQTERITS